MSRMDKYLDSKIVQNLFVWILLYIIVTITIRNNNSVLTALFVVGLFAPAAYINNLLVLPYLKKQKGVFFLLFILNTTIATAVFVFIFLSIMGGNFEIGLFLNMFGILTLAMSFASALKLARDSYLRRQQDQEAELKLLKAQLNPHFLFNTLNNLYGLSVVKSDKLPELMLKLSDLLRYSLYDTKESLVPLEKEITYLDNYISLEKIRLEDKASIEFTKSGNLSNKKIAPMLLIVFVENAFKHLQSGKDEKSKVLVSIEGKADCIYFTCKNSIDPMESKSTKIKIEPGGIGLQNAKKRLNLQYAEKHTLNIIQSDDNYIVELKLD